MLVQRTEDLSLLEVNDIEVRFGGLIALGGLSFSLEEGGICSLIGPNGAGKTTLFNVVSRLYQPSSGSVTFAGRDLLALPAHKIASNGIARTFQNLALVPGLSVLDNVMIGAHPRTRGGVWAAASWFPLRAQETRTRTRALEVLERLDLDRFAAARCAGLPYGTLKRIELARSLMSDPRLLLLDEPASGLTHSEVDELASVITSIRDEFSMTVLLVEHHMGMVMSVSDSIVVMELGRKIAEGTPQEIQSNARVIAAYLGEPEEATS
jgi:branched-chain amino acid transport system ATP-binding protein